MGLYWGWIVCVSFLVLFTMSAGIAFSFTEMMVPISKETHVSLSLLGWVGALPSSLPMLAAPLATWINYRLGTRKTVIVGVFVTTFSLSWMVVGENVILLLMVYGLLSGIGIMMIVNPPFYLVEEYFPYDHPRHVLATSLIACGFPLATIIFNPVTYELIAAVGWRFTYSIFALMMLIIGSATTATFRPCRQHEVQLEMMSSEGGSTVAYEEMAGDVIKEPYYPSSIRRQSILLTTPTRTKIIMGCIWFTASVFKSMGYYTPITTLVMQMDVLGIPQWKASRAMSLIGACEVVSRLVTSYLGDRVKGKILYVYVICSLVLMLQNGLGSMATTFNYLLIYAAAQGLSGGPIIAAMYSSGSEVLGGNFVPELFSIFRAGLGLGGLLGPTVAGAIFDTFGSFRTVFFFNSGCYAVTSISYLLVIFINRKRPTFFFPTNICDAAVGSVIETRTHTNGEIGNQSTASLDHQARLRLESEGAREDDDIFDKQTTARSYSTLP